MTDPRIQRLLADVFRTRIVDVTDDDVRSFVAELDRHDLMLMPRSAALR